METAAMETYVRRELIAPAFCGSGYSAACSTRS